MKLIVFGATGGTGREVVQRALAMGHEVTAFARRPEGVKVKHERLRVAQGDATKAEDVARAVAGHDAVISAIGPAKGVPAGTIISDAVRNIVAAMQQGGVRRFVYESGLMVGDGAEFGLFQRLALALFKRINGALYRDKLRAEAMITASSVEWTIVRPPVLVEAPGTGKYRAGPKLAIRIGRSLAHADVADYLVRTLSEKGTIRQIVNVGH